MQAWLGVLVVLAAAAALLGGLATFGRRLPGELSRKLAHIGTGLIALALPLLFDERWPAVAAIALAGVALAAMRALPALRRTIGAAVHNVDRASYGEFWLLASIALLFALTGGGVLYVVPIIIVTFADAAAALVGITYGRVRYDTTEGKKSVEGSIAFFNVAFLGAHVPVLLWTEVGRAESLLIAFILGFLLVLFEGAAWKGLDNLFIPLSSFIVLRELMPRPADELVVVLAVALAMGAFAFAWRSRTTLNDGALFGAVLMGFLFWAVGGWRWLVPPVVVFAAYTLLPPRNDLDTMRIHNVHVVLSVTGAGLAWLFARRVAGEPSLYLPFTAAFAAHLAIISLVRFKYARPAMRVGTLMAVSVAQAAALVVAPYVLIVGATPRSLLDGAALLAAVLVAALLFHAIQYRGADKPDPVRRWRREGACAALASGLVALLLLV